MFRWQRGENDMTNDLVVRTLFYDSPAVLAELLTFLHTQADQVRSIILDTPDDFFHYLPHDPRNGAPEIIYEECHQTNVQGVGLMYRVVDIPALFRLLAECDFGAPFAFGRSPAKGSPAATPASGNSININGAPFRLRLTIADTLLPENAGSTLLHFDAGRVSVAKRGKHDVEISLDIADFSSLLVGAVDLASLYRLGRAQVSDPAYVGLVGRILAVEKPICTSLF
jgi:hypothetical protein